MIVSSMYNFFFNVTPCLIHVHVIKPKKKKREPKITYKMKLWNVCDIARSVPLPSKNKLPPLDFNKAFKDPFTVAMMNHPFPLLAL